MLKNRAFIRLEVCNRSRHRFKGIHKSVAKRDELIVGSGREVTVIRKSLAEKSMSKAVAFGHQLTEVIGCLGLQVRSDGLFDGLGSHAKERCL